MKDTEFAQLYRQHYQLIRRRCRSLVGPVPDLDDIVQEAFLRAYNAYDRFEDQKGSFPRWISVIVRNTAISWLRRKNREEPDPTVIERIDSAAAQAAPDVEIPRRFWVAWAGLSEQHRQVIGLLVEGYEVAEIAATLEIPRVTAGTRIFRARQRLKRALTE